MMPRYLDFDKVDYLDNDVLVYEKRVYDIACGDKLPFENVAPVIHAHWIYQGLSPYNCFSRCSCCDVVFDGYETLEYCPKCGAKMDEVVG